VPAGSQVESVRGLDAGTLEEDREGDKKVFAGFFVLAPGEVREVTFTYRLPPDVVAEGAYRLTLQKQAGTDGWPWRVTVRAPEGALQAAQPAPQEQKGGEVIFSGHLRVDQSVRVEYR